MKSCQSPVEDIESHYRVAYYYAFLDHTISHLKTRFPPELELLSACNFAQENRLFYPNIHAVLLLLCLPVGSCSCEPSFSALRRLKTWSRSSMTDERLDSLAPGYINQERSFSPEVLRVWDRSGHHRVALAFRPE